MGFHKIWLWIVIPAAFVTAIFFPTLLFSFLLSFALLVRFRTLNVVAETANARAATIRNANLQLRSPPSF